MRVAVSGTPGTGKTTATRRLDTSLDVVHLNDTVEERGFYTERDDSRGTLVADLEAIGDWLEGRDDVLVESHLAHRFDMDRVVVLRCHPAELERRLRDRGEPPQTVAENAESEALDLILSEAVSRHGRDRVYEIDTTDRSADETAREIERVIAGDRRPAAGTVSYLDYL